jgi:hypothetical protein
MQLLDLWISRLKSADFDDGTPSIEPNFPFREITAGPLGPAAGRSRSSNGSRLDDDFAFHVRMDRAQIVVVARGRKSERELGVLDEVFDRKAWFGFTTVCGMVSLLTQVTVVPGATVISPGMKVLWSMVTDATGPVPALFESSAGLGADARAPNRMARLSARRTLCGLQPWTPKQIRGIAAKCIESRTVKATSLF